MHKRDEIIDIEITDAGDGAKWFGRTADGMGLFVTGMAAPGDRVRVRITRVKSNLLEGKIQELLHTAEGRTPPVCDHFGVCGGCQWQHIQYTRQLAMKHRRVQDAFRHIGGLGTIQLLAPIGADRLTHYRNKVEFSFSNRRYCLAGERETSANDLDKPMEFALGFHAPKMFAKVVDIDRCHIATPEMNIALEVTKDFCLRNRLRPYSTISHQGFLRHLAIRQCCNNPGMLVNFVTSVYDRDIAEQLYGELAERLPETLTTFVNNVTTRKSEFSAGEAEFVIRGDGFVRERLIGLQFQISANSFFQTNTRMAEKLCAIVKAGAQLGPADVVYDLYCGAGTLAITVAGGCARVLGLETSPHAVEDARVNAALNRIENCTFVKTDLHREDADRAVANHPRPDIVIADPPRAGMSRESIHWLVGLRPRRIVYVSCNPASLARDCSLLCYGGDYRLGTVQPIDMFPHTNHVECVAVLDRVIAAQG